MEHGMSFALTRASTVASACAPPRPRSVVATRRPAAATAVAVPWTWTWRAGAIVSAPLRGLLAVATALLGLKRETRRRWRRTWKDLFKITGAPNSAHWVAVQPQKSELMPFVSSKAPLERTSQIVNPGEVLDNLGKWGQEVASNTTEFFANAVGAVADAASAVLPLAGGPMAGGPIANHQLTASTPARNDAKAAARSFMQVGSLYQNGYRSHWNSSSTPVSGLLNITGPDSFELIVENLDSVGSGSEGKVTLRSAFVTEEIPDKPGRLRLLLREDKTVETLEYDSKLFDRTGNFALSCMKRATGALLSAFNLEVDTETDKIYCSARAAVLRMFWTTSVELAPTDKESVWRHDKDVVQPELAPAPSVNDLPLAIA